MLLGSLFGGSADGLKGRVLLSRQGEEAWPLDKDVVEHRGWAWGSADPSADFEGGEIGGSETGLT